ncbi:DUF6482 family protein [Chromatocurvus halotolerans]|uniref:Uncharacterized protein n=1 Tax=Chromatocurvus halotolerans TaxID=1132028 RepID=A0A4R2KW39_9GAMM|nr:DUF6482 family protein [Chromatocurvus halotolerans]TCO77057.1 hypothetical protein EV688_10371 [Chromatocurvus halotolerans]
MKITLRELGARHVQKLVIESVDLSLYIAEATVDDEVHLVVDDAGKPLRERNLTGMKRHFAGMSVDACVLRQRSAYDEMIGHRWQAADNTLEIPMTTAAQPLPDWQH